MASQTGSTPAGNGTTGAAQPADPGARLLLRIGDFIEPLTRFDRRHLTMSESRHEVVQVLARQTFRMSYETQASEGEGDLPAGVEQVADAAALARESAAQTEAARVTAPAKLAAWAEQHGEDPLAKPAVGDCFLSLPPLGIVETCSVCTGEGKVSCSRCSGSGETTCETCKGKGSSACEACEATGAVSCQTCKGSGVVMEERQRKVYDDAIDQERIEHYQEAAPCSVCNKKGSVTCRVCEGKGEIACPACEGRKTVTCVRCKGAGTETCAACAGTGKKHRILALSCTVHETFEVAPRSSDPEIASVLKSQPGIADVLRLSTAHRAVAETSANTMRRDTLVEVPVTSALISIGEQQKALIRGFGPEQEVLDYRNLAGMLLVGDMVQLDSAIAMTRLVPPKVNETIYTALANVLASEANVAIVGEASKRTPQEMERVFRGVVTADYIKRAAAGIRTAVGRSYWAGLAKGPAWGFLLPLLFAPLDFLARGSGAGARIGLLLGIMLLTFAIAGLGHLWVVRALQKRIAPKGEPRIGAIVDRLGLTRIWLIGSGVAAFLLTLLVAGLTSWAFPVR